MMTLEDKNDDGWTGNSKRVVVLRGSVTEVLLAQE